VSGIGLGISPFLTHVFRPDSSSESFFLSLARAAWLSFLARGHSYPSKIFLQQPCFRQLHTPVSSSVFFPFLSTRCVRHVLQLFSHQRGHSSLSLTLILCPDLTICGEDGFFRNFPLSMEILSFFPLVKWGWGVRDFAVSVFFFFFFLVWLFSSLLIRPLYLSF